MMVVPLLFHLLARWASADLPEPKAVPQAESDRVDPAGPPAPEAVPEPEHHPPDPAAGPPAPEAVPEPEDHPPDPAGAPPPTASSPNATAAPTDTTPTPPPAEPTTGVEAAVAPPEARRGATLSFEPGKGLVIESTDHRFGFLITAYIQLLATFARDPRASTTLSHAFEIRRAHLRLLAHVFSEHNKMFINLGFSPRGLQVVDGHPTKTPLFDWGFEFDHLRNATFRAGQYRVPFSRERRVPITDLEFVDRSLANFEFNLDRDVGFDIRSDDIAGLGRLRYDVGIFTGEGRDAFAPSGFNFLYVARFEVLPLGPFSDYTQTDFARLPKPHVSIGGAYAFFDNAAANRGSLGTKPSDGGTTDMHLVTGDVIGKFRGASIHADVYWRQGTRNYGDAVVTAEDGTTLPADREPPRNGLGWSAQIGYLVRRIPLEPLVRYSGVIPLQQSSMSRQEELGAGAQWFFHQSALKVAVDYFRTYDNGAIGKGSDRLRLQFQMMF